MIREALALTLLVGLVACSGEPAPAKSAPEPIVDRGCATYTVLGARGSTQDATKNYGVGTEIRVTAVALAARLHHSAPSTTTRIVPINYDASASATSAAYLQHVADGAELAESQIKKLGQRCPNTRFVLMGFSQGAQVVHATALDLPDSLAQRVGAVAMIADPRRNPDDAIVQWTYGTPAPRAGRLGAGTPIGANLRQVSISFCATGDEICNGSGSAGSTPSMTHKEFYEQPAHAEQTAKHIADLL